MAALPKAKEIVSSNPVVVFRFPSRHLLQCTKQRVCEDMLILNGFLELVVCCRKSYCPYCIEVKKLLTKLGANYKAVELNSESDGSEIQSALAEWTGQRTVPNVFIGGNHIGGCDTTTALDNQGKLVPLLTSAGAIAATIST